MTNSIKWIGLIVTTALWAGGVSAFGQSFQEFSGDSPADLPMPSAMSGGMPSSSEEALPTPTDAAAPAGSSEFSNMSRGDGYEANPNCGYDVTNMWDQIPPIESTGTWLRRGFWYAEADGLALTRMWDRSSLRLAAADQNVNLPPVNNQSLGFNPVFLDTNRLLILNGALPGEDATVRATLGNFLFRDSHNRDHTLEFTVLGGGNWEQERVITSDQPFGLFVPFRIDGGNPSFDGSSRQTVDYQSHLKDFELNYRVRQRLGRDQIVMDANGDWHRAANAGFEREYLAGIRIMEMEDKFDWKAEDIVATGDDGRYFIRTDNDLIGAQLGGGASYQAARWSLGLFGKGGVFLNDALGRNELTFTNPASEDSDLRFRENQLSFAAEFKLQSRFHVTPNFSLHAGYELMYISAVALAPNQATFIPEFSYLNTSGDVFYHGISFGVDGYW